MANNNENGRHFGLSQIVDRRIAAASTIAALTLAACGASAATPANTEAPSSSSPSTAPSAGIDYDLLAQKVAQQMEKDLANKGAIPSSSAETITAGGYGEDAWSQNLANWGPIVIDGKTEGVVMNAEPTGRNSIVNTDMSVAQAYWDAKISEGKSNSAIGLVIAPNLTVPVRMVSEYPLNGEDGKAATQRAFEGQVTLEHQTQPGVCTLEITNSIHAVKGNEQTVSQDMWQAEKLTPEQAAAKFGRDAWSKNSSNWTSVDEGFGAKLTVNPDGTNSIVAMDGAVGQAYWDGSFTQEATNGHQVTAGTLRPGVIAPVRGVTVYAGVPAGMEDAAAGNAFAKAVNLEINGLGQPERAQEGVYVVLVSKSDCPAAEQPAQTNPGATAAPTPESTAKPTVSPTAKPEATPNPTSWMLPFEKSLGDRAHPLAGFSNGLKIDLGKKVKVAITKGERIDTPMGPHDGPWGGYVTVATIWKLN